MVTKETMATLPRLSFTLNEAAYVTGIAKRRLLEAVSDNRLTVHIDGKSNIVLVSELWRYLKALPAKGRVYEEFQP